MMNNKGQKGEQIKNKAQSFNFCLCGLSKQRLARAEVEHTLFDFHSSPAYQQCQLVDWSTTGNLLRCHLKLELTAVILLAVMTLSNSNYASQALAPRRVFSSGVSLMLVVPERFLLTYIGHYIIQTLSWGALIVFRVFFEGLANNNNWIT